MIYIEFIYYIWVWIYHLHIPKLDYPEFPPLFSNNTNILSPFFHITQLMAKQWTYDRQYNFISNWRFYTGVQCLLIELFYFHPNSEEDTKISVRFQSPKIATYKTQFAKIKSKNVKDQSQNTYKYIRKTDNHKILE